MYFALKVTRVKLLRTVKGQRIEPSLTHFCCRKKCRCTPHMSPLTLTVTSVSEIPVVILNEGFQDSSSIIFSEKANGESMPELLTGHVCSEEWLYSAGHLSYTLVEVAARH